MNDTKDTLPDDLKACVDFHGHLCPGLIYGYLVSKESIRRLNIERSEDEEVVAISENDTCAVDALQIMLGTTTGKGNLILKDYGKNVFTILSRSSHRAVRFSRRFDYHYDGAEPEEFAQLEAAFAAGRATEKQRKRQKHLKSMDLLSKPFEAVFDAREVALPEPPYAPLAPSEACAACGEITMATKLKITEEGKGLCIPCFQENAKSRG